MENIGPVASYTEGLRAIKFLARLSRLPIIFFGLDPSPHSNQLWLTYNKRRHEELFREGSVGMGMGSHELAGALDAWRCLNRTHQRRKISNPRAVKPRTFNDVKLSFQYDEEKT